MYGGMKLLATFDREKEKNLWFPILSSHGFSWLELSTDNADREKAIDTTGLDSEGTVKRFALRTRHERYSQRQLAKYKREFTIRYARPSGSPVEWQKLFEMDLDLLPDYFCYGWWNKTTNLISDYVILDVPTLQELFRQGYLERYRQNRKQNVNSHRSTLVFIRISELINLPSGNTLIAYHSENHPAL